MVWCRLPGTLPRCSTSRGTASSLVIVHYREKAQQRYTLGGIIMSHYWHANGCPYEHSGKTCWWPSLWLASGRSYLLLAAKAPGTPISLSSRTPPVFVFNPLYIQHSIIYKWLRAWTPLWQQKYDQSNDTIVVQLFTQTGCRDCQTGHPLCPHIKKKRSWKTSAVSTTVWMVETQLLQAAWYIRRVRIIWFLWT